MSDLALSIKNVSRDLEVQKYPPILTPEEEYNLAIELYEDGSLSAAQKLVLAHMRFVAFVAHGYKGYGLEQADLIQEGTIGLMKAVKRFNPHKKVRLLHLLFTGYALKFTNIFSRIGKLLRLLQQKHKENSFSN